MNDLIPGLLAPQATIAPKYFYDTAGSALFDAITRQPEYYPTRTERGILALHAATIAARVGPGRTLIEPGAGNCEKARALCPHLRPACFVALDIAADFLHPAAAALAADFPAIDVRVLAADITQALTLPPDLPPHPRLVFYPGSSIGNFDPPEALALLQRFHALAGARGALLIGVDLRKPVPLLEAAYDDAAGVTAAFNLNVLAHVNRLIGSDFNLAQWRHRAFFNEALSRIEMHLVAAVDCLVRWPGGSRAFAAGESIHTENSYKYEVEGFAALLAAVGFGRSVAWTNEGQGYAVFLAEQGGVVGG